MESTTVAEEYGDYLREHEPAVFEHVLLFSQCIKQYLQNIFYARGSSNWTMRLCAEQFTLVKEFPRPGHGLGLHNERYVRVAVTWYFEHPGQFGAGVYSLVTDEPSLLFTGHHPRECVQFLCQCFYGRPFPPPPPPPPQPQPLPTLVIQIDDDANVDAVDVSSDSQTDVGGNNNNNNNSSSNSSENVVVDVIEEALSDAHAADSLLALQFQPPKSSDDQQGEAIYTATVVEDTDALPLSSQVTTPLKVRIKTCRSCKNVLPSNKQKRKEHLEFCVSRFVGAPNPFQKRACAPTNLKEVNPPRYRQLPETTATTTKKRPREKSLPIEKEKEEKKKKTINKEKKEESPPPHKKQRRDNDDDVHTVEKIIGHITDPKTGQLLFHVKWHTADAAADGVAYTYEPMSSFVDLSPEGGWLGITQQFADYMVAMKLSMAPTSELLHASS